MIENSLKKRKHVVEYSRSQIPDKTEIINILRRGYQLASSKQNSFPYKIFVYGPNETRSDHLQKLTEGNKINTDGELPPNTTYTPNPNLYHIATAPYTLIITPRLAPPNEYYRKQIKDHGSYWEFDKEEKLRPCGKAFAIEVGIIATTITGVAIDQGWDSSYCVCFPKEIQQYKKFSDIKYIPYLIQTIGKGIKFRKDVYKKESLIMDKRPNFDEIFKIID